MKNDDNISFQINLVKLKEIIAELFFNGQVKKNLTVEIMAIDAERVVHPSQFNFFQNWALNVFSTLIKPIGNVISEWC